MNAGFSSLKILKAQLLAEALQATTRYDARILAIGKGSAAAIDNFCNRKLTRATSDIYSGPADRTHCILPRYPVESISKVEFKADEVIGWEEQTSNAYISLKAESGILYFGASLGPHWSQIRVTYTGGYWFDTTEEGNDTLPSGATALPDDVRLAWFLQCQQVWQAQDKLGADIAKTGSSSQFVTGSLAGLELSPLVKSMLGQFIRYAAT